MKYFLLLVSLTLALASQGQSQTRSPSSLALPKDLATEGSVYDLESVWRTQEGAEIKLSGLKGKVRVVAMGYTSCQYACPRIIADLQRIEKELDAKGLNSNEVSISFISIDPEVDTPARMKQLENEYRMDSKRWLLLTGNEDGVLELAVALGMKYRKTSAMDFAHSNIISVLTPDGHIAYQTSEIGSDLSVMMGIISQWKPIL